MTYKLYIRYSLSGLIVEVRYFESQDAFYSYIGKLVLRSIEHIERIDYEILREKEEESI